MENTLTAACTTIYGPTVQKNAWSILIIHLMIILERQSHRFLLEKFSGNIWKVWNTIKGVQTGFVYQFACLSVETLNSGLICI